MEYPPQSPVHFVASASTTCSQGVASMGIYTAASKLAYVVKGSKLDTSLDLAPGTYKVVVEEWNNCGSVASQVLTITVIKGEVQVASPANNATVPLRGVSNLGLL